MSGYYAAADQPGIGPSEAPGLWGGEPNMAPPDWTGRTSYWGLSELRVLNQRHPPALGRADMRAY